MGVFYNSNANIIYNIVNYLAILSSVLLVMIIVYSTFKILTGDEQDHQRYLKRIRNGIIAFILILVLNPIINLTGKYFRPNSNDNSYTGIGDFRKYANYNSNQGIDKEYKDKSNRQMIQVDNDVYVRTRTQYTKNFGGFLKPCKLEVEEYKDFETSQGATSGGASKVSYYKIVEIPSENELVDSKYKNCLIPGNWQEIVGNKIKEQDDWDSLAEALVGKDQYSVPKSSRR